MKVAVVSYSLSKTFTAPAQWEEFVTEEILRLIADGAKIILYPEYCQLALAPLLNNNLTDVASYVEAFLPKLATKLKGKDVCVCLGSGPRLVNGKIRNSSPVWVNEVWIFQDKIHLTPWEDHISAGSEIQFFEFQGLSAACVICYDIEQPGIALKLKRNNVDLVLVPSATADKNGSQRVLRCSSARSVELGAAVIVSPLVGKSTFDLVDANEGKQGFFLPAQAAVLEQQESYSVYSTEQHLVHVFDLNLVTMEEVKKRDKETKPFYKEDLILP